MERDNRPLGREKKVTSGSAHVGRRENGPQKPGNYGKTGSTGSSTPTRSSGGGSKSLLILVVVALVVFIFGGKDAALSLLGLGSGTGISSSSTLLDSFNGDLGSLTGGSSSSSSGSILDSLLGGGGTTNNNSASSIDASTSTTTTGGDLDANVSDKARDKRTVIKGNGKDVITVMIYMCGTDLESGGGFASKDLQEMASANIGDKLNVLVFTGGCKKWQNSVISSSKNQIFQIKNGGLKLLSETSSLLPMTDPATLSGFIKWGKANYPADRYELIFWDHGGGSVSGYGYDEKFAKNGSMTLDKIAEALKDGGCIFDFIGFDACLMATLETALVVEPYADYLIASEETEPGCGWYYTNWMTKLSSNTSMPTLEVGKNIVDDFVSVCAKNARGQQTTLSVVDLAELSGTVPEAFKSFALSTTEMIKDDDYKTVANARGKTKEFASSTNIDQVDLVHLAQNINSKEAKALVNALKGAVKYNLTSNNVQNANGISIYFPYDRMSNVSKMAATYNRIGLDSAYSDCIKSFASVEAGGQTISGGSSAQMSSLFGSLLSGGSSYSSGSSVSSGDLVGELLGSLLSGGRSLAGIGLDEDESDFIDEDALSENEKYLAKNQFDVSALEWKEKDGQPVLELSEDQWDLIQNVELNVFVDDGEGYIDLGLDNVFSFNDDGDLIGEYDQTWLCINKQIVAYYMLSAEGNSSDYKIMGYVPAMLNDQRVNLIISFTDENPDGEVLGASICYDEEEETETIARGLLEIVNGDAIDFLCNYYDYDQNFQDEYYLGDQMIVNGELEVSNIKMDNSDYIATYRLTDIYHNYYWTPSMQ